MVPSFKSPYVHHPGSNLCRHNGLPIYIQEYTHSTFLTKIDSPLGQIIHYITPFNHYLCIFFGLIINVFLVCHKQLSHEMLMLRDKSQLFLDSKSVFSVFCTTQTLFPCVELTFYSFLCSLFRF